MHTRGGQIARQISDHLTQSLHAACRGADHDQVAACPGLLGGVSGLHMRQPTLIRRPAASADQRAASGSSRSQSASARLTARANGNGLKP